MDTAHAHARWRSGGVRHHRTRRSKVDPDPPEVVPESRLHRRPVPVSRSCPCRARAPAATYGRARDDAAQRWSSAGRAVESVFPGVAVQRGLWHLARGVYRAARYSDKASHELADSFRTQLGALLHAAYANHDLVAARTAYDLLIHDAKGCGAWAAAAHLRSATDEALTFLVHPDAGRLVFGHKGRPELGTGVLARVMREMNRRTDVGVRWSVEGVRAILMIRCARKYHHGRWSADEAATDQPKVRFILVA